MLQEMNIKARFNCRSVCSVFEVDGAGSVFNTGDQHQR